MKTMPTMRAARPLGDRALGAHLQVDRPVHDEHRQAHHAREQGEGVEQPEKAAAVKRAQHVVERKRHPLQQVSEGHPEDQRRHGAADDQAPVPGAAPARVGHLAAVLEAHRPEEQGEEHEQQRPVEAREGGGIDQGPGGKDGPARGDEPDLVPVPVGAHRVDDDAPLGVVLAQEGEQGADPHIHAVGDGEADKEDAHQHPPGELQDFIVDDHAVSPGFLIRPRCPAAEVPSPAAPRRSRGLPDARGDSGPYAMSSAPGGRT